MTRSLVWGAKVSSRFRDRLFEMCARLGWDDPKDEHANWLMACIAFETGGTFDPNCRNLAGSNAIGLIQFMPSTAKDLGTSTERLSCMSAEGQLRYVEMYFLPYAKRIHSMEDMYMAILMPKYIGKPLDSILFTKGGTAYRQNSGLDVNTDGKITKEEAASRVRVRLGRGKIAGNVWTG